MGKLKLCVIFGGQSPEHEISLRSVTSVLENLDKDKYKITTVGITRKGEWYLYSGKPEKIITGDWQKDKKHLKKAIISPDTGDKGLLVFDDGEIKRVKIDVVFPVLHGEYGEDGTIQGLLELAELKYVGMGVLGSANGMDKTYSKIIFQDAGIPQADWVVVRTSEFEQMNSVIKKIEEKLGYPCFVKPANTGSSVGVGKANNAQELEEALLNAGMFDRKILVEENIDGHEVECAVLGNEAPKASVIGEILPTVEFYDFDAKYKDDTTKLDIPAKLDDAVTEQIREYAVRAFTALNGMGLSRVDFFVRYSDQSIVLNEINTMPGFTNISMYPKLWGAKGISYRELLDRLIALAQKRSK